jgi:hypothetical protein
LITALRFLTYTKSNDVTHTLAGDVMEDSFGGSVFDSNTSIQLFLFQRFEVFALALFPMPAHA